MLGLVADFFAGVFLCNCIPHLAAGLRGELFPSPFAKPPGIGNSRPFVNVIWGMLNLVIGLALLSYAPVAIGLYLPFIVAIAGALLGGIYIAGHFGRVRTSSNAR